jgi:reverse gyrase
METHVMRVARWLGVLGLFSEEQIEREHHLSKLQMRYTNANDFYTSQTQMEQKKGAKRNPKAAQLIQAVDAKRKRGDGQYKNKN